VLPALGHLKLAALQPAHLQELYSNLLPDGLSPKTVCNVHGVIHRALEQAASWNLVPRNVARLVSPPRAQRKEIEILGPSQVHDLIAVSKGTRLEVLIAMALATGLRQGELLALRWKDVDMDSGVLQVRRQLGRDKQYAKPKTAKGRRSVGLPPSTVVALSEHKVRQAQEQQLMGPEWEFNELVFATHSGRCLGHRNVLRDYKKLLAKAGLPDVSFHALRHTSATLLLLQAAHPKVVSERLGHSRVGVTLDVYSHVMPSMDRDVAIRLDAMLV